MDLHWRPFQPSASEQKLPLLAALYLIAPLVLGGVCGLEGSTFAAYGAPFQIELLCSMLSGLAAGSLGLIAMFWLQQRLGWLTWGTASTAQNSARSSASQAAVPTTVQTQWSRGLQIFLLLLLGLWVGWTEELVFRGFLQTQLERDLPTWGAAAMISLFFALLHWVWEGRAIGLQIPGLWLMGIVLVLARWVDQGQLGLAWGLHAGWVWTLASLDTLSLIHYTGKVPSWITGYDAKPLAGAIGLLFLGMTAIGLWVVGK